MTGKLLCKLIAAAFLPAVFSPASICGALTLVEDGAARAVIVIADDAGSTARYAAEELVKHMEKASGAKLPVVAESRMDSTDKQARIFVGITESAKAIGLDPEQLERDGFFLRKDGNNLYVLGQEDHRLDSLLHHDIERSVLYYGWFPRAKTPPGGTLFGIYEILSRYAGVLWIWPGELGTYIPSSRNISIPGELDEIHNPKIKMRQFAWQGLANQRRRYDPDLERIGFSREGLENYHRDLAVYLARHRLGRSERRPRSRHHFAGWWGRYGEDNPEWFMLNEAGERGPMPGASVQHVAMCVSNPDLHRYIVEEHWSGPGHDIPLGEVDARVFCLCEDCKKWDREESQAQPRFVNYDPVVSDRYLRFWNRIAEMAVEKDPDVTVTTYLYWNYMPAPAAGAKVHENVYGEFCHWSDPYRYFPMPGEAEKWLREQWLGWRETGIRMAYRPNIFHRGYVMPDLNTRQAGEFFKFAYENGMEHFYFDTLYGHWATRGPMLYMFMRLAWNPGLDLDRVLDEYFSAFGPAAKYVEKYFDYWERYSKVRGGGHLYTPVNAHTAYPEEVFKPAEKLLEDALQAASKHPGAEYAARVEFLKSGLEHARLSRRFTAALHRGGNLPDIDTDRFRAAQAALRALIEFRRETEHMYISDLVDAARRENRRIDIDTLIKDIEKAGDAAAPGQKISSGVPVSVLLNPPNKLDDPWGEWHFRRDPEDKGLKSGWYNPGKEIDENWEPVDVPAPLTYLGFGWYRTTFELPEEWGNFNPKLLFYGVDEQAWIYVNGIPAGEHTVESEGLGIGSLYDRPFVIDLRPDTLDETGVQIPVNPGGTNHLAVRFHASVGQSGIWKNIVLFAEERN